MLFSTEIFITYITYTTYMSKKEPLIIRVRGNGNNKQKVVTIPRDSNIEIGDYVQVEKLKLR